MMPQQYCLRWKHHHSNVQSMFAQLLEKERFCDVTLYCSSNFASQLSEEATEASRGVSVRAHRVVLAACSELLATLLGAHESQGEPVLVVDGARPDHVRALLDYMYTGEMSVHHSELPSLLKTAEELKIKGLTDIRWTDKGSPETEGAVLTTSDTKQSSPEHHSSDDRVALNGGPPPLIKLPVKERSPPIKREAALSDCDSQSPKRQRIASGTDHTDDESRDPEAWKHGNLDISAEPVSPWRAGSMGTDLGTGRSPSPSGEWDGPDDIGSFLHTRLTVHEESSDGDSLPPTSSSSLLETSSGGQDLSRGQHRPLQNIASKPTSGSKVTGVGGNSDPRFSDVIKLNEYLRHGRRPQFWEEDYVKRVMEAVRLKELEMKQAAEVLGVSYGTLYGRYRDVYGCINRPYRNARDFWSSKGPGEALERLQRGELTEGTFGSLPTFAVAPGGGRDHGHYADIQHVPEKDFEPIPIEIDPLLKLKPFPSVSASPLASCPSKPMRKNASIAERTVKRILIGSLDSDEPPATIISMDGKTTTTALARWPRAPSGGTLGGSVGAVGGVGVAGGERPASPSQLMRTRPDLTIVAARKPEPPPPTKPDEENGPGT